jgi:hypothetical protein
LALGFHVVEIEGVDVLLAVVGRDVTEDEDVAALRQRRQKLAQTGGVRAGTGSQKQQCRTDNPEHLHLVLFAGRA